ncbi:serine/threonine protein kinase [Waterburya agarophytonicola K14]|uniref:non-specific serine/threonine protein kinase n=1 Tax=Waterburya agarophytonicola KI4 TaxID=2874699 RepID=A0A964BNY3_9CYAN|nr:serine/threonine-protein kinase [Waterburya agarophytonicola]MCC0176884.1 serine/threonine protein kinase [Waterburya agarophytonicola KI4]
MEIICTRPGCPKPRNFFGDLDDEAKIRTVRQKFCVSCGMPLLLADRYIPSKLLGQGGFGAAFLACDRYKPKMPLCVVKQFQPSGDLDDRELAVAQNLFQREAVVLEELGHKHPQIPDLYAFFTPIVRNAKDTEDEQYFYLAQEFIDGEDLEEELAAKGKFSEAEVVEILKEILKVLQFVHDNNTIHRDIKPSNIMRDKRGILYLLDFGAVKQVAIGGGNNKKSTGVYSMGFAPPEQMSGSQVYPSTDIYALAVTCITLLTGKPAEELYDSFNHNWQWRGFAPQTSDRLMDILDRMLLSAPAQRFQSATDALAALTPPPPAKPAQVVPQKPSPPATLIKLPKNPFSLIEAISGAAFTGFEGALLYIGLTNLLSVSGISLGILGMVMGGIVFALYRRAIEKVDLIIFGGITAGIVAFIPALHGALVIKFVLMIAAISAAGAIAITAFFRLVYQLLSRFL